MVVERQLEAEGKTRHDLGREAFLERVWDWKAHSGGIISDQMRRMGRRWTGHVSASPWTTACQPPCRSLRPPVRRRPDLPGQAAGQLGPGAAHRGVRPRGAVCRGTGHLWHFRYPLADGSGHLVVATTRPETMLGDTAVAVHPEDERYQSLIGKTVRLPLADREIPVIADDYVDPEFGTGCVKITPAHDFNDYEMGQRHDLETINIFTVDAALNDEVPAAYRGLDRFDARKRVWLTSMPSACSTDSGSSADGAAGRSQRRGRRAVSDRPVVRKDRAAGRTGHRGRGVGAIRFVPENWSKTYYDWMRNIQDWCISRQLWWGHRIPAWYDNDGNIWVGRSEAEARARAGLAEMRRCAGTKTYSTPGSRRRCGPSPPSAGRKTRRH